MNLEQKHLMLQLGSHEFVWHTHLPCLYDIHTSHFCMAYFCERHTQSTRKQHLTPWGCPQGLRVRPPGIEWKTGRNPKMGKNWQQKNRKWPSARNGEKMAQKWRKNRKLTPNSFFGPFFLHFGPRGIFSFLANFFPFLVFGPFSILYQAAWLATQGLILLVVCHAKTPHERFHDTSHEAVHGSVHESVHSSD